MKTIIVQEVGSGGRFPGFRVVLITIEQPTRRATVRTEFVLEMFVSPDGDRMSRNQDEALGYAQTLGGILGIDVAEEIGQAP